VNLVPKPAQKKLLTDAAKLYYDQLLGSEEHMTYLKNRGVTEDLMRSFGLGAVVEPVSNHEDFRGWISIPYFTPGGVVSIRFRRLVSDVSPKYMDLPGEPPRLYNTRALFRDEDIYVCEGELDAVVAWGAGLAAVAVNGSDKWNRVFGRILAHRDVTVLQDGDDAGRKFANEIYKDLGGCKIVKMPKGEDVTSFVKLYGSEALIEKVKHE